LILALLAALPLGAYWSTLNNYFLNSDFAHLMYADIVRKYPQMLGREFQQSWLGQGDFETVFRPLPLVLLVFNLATTGINPIGFHLTNLLLHIGCTCFVYLFTIELLQWFKLDADSEDATFVPKRLTAFFAAAFFSIYPVCAEPVIWLGGRPDCAAGLFFVLTLWLWIKEQTTGKIEFGLLSVVSYLVALLFQELPIVLILLPPLLYLARQAPLNERLTGALRSTWRLALVLAAYFLMRWLALGSAAGGYSDALWKLVGADDGLIRWFDPVQIGRMFHPFYSELALVKPINLLFSAAYVAMIVLVLIRIKSLKPIVAPVTVCLVWFAISLFPAFRSAPLTDALTGGRFFYIASVPLCLIFALLLTQPFDPTRWRRLLAGVIGGVLLLCFGVTDRFNNQVWSEASSTTKSFRDQLVETIKKLPEDKQVIVMNPPISINGHYGLNQALIRCFLEPPFEENGLADKLTTIDRQHFGEQDAYLINATALRQELLTQCWVTKWDEKTAKLSLIELIPDLMPLTSHNISVNEAAEKMPQPMSYELTIDPSIGPMSCEAIEVEFSCEGTSKPGYATLGWRDDWRWPPTNIYDYDIYVGLNGDAQKHTYRFPLAERIGWYLQTPKENLYLRIYNVKAVSNITARLATDAFYVPRLRPEMRFMRPTPTGFVPRNKEAVFLCDSEVPGTEKLIIELSKPNESFELYTKTYRDTTVSEHALNRWEADGVSSCFRIPLAGLAPGVYNLRAAALGKDRRIVGAFGDPVVFRVSGN